jgi:serine/threonine protein kinase
MRRVIRPRLNQEPLARQQYSVLRIADCSDDHVPVVVKTTLTQYADNEIYFLDRCRHAQFVVSRVEGELCSEEGGNNASTISSGEDASQPSHVSQSSIVMELMDGDLLSLTERARKFPHNAPAVDFFDIAEQLLSALCFLHNERRVIHRDLKPENVLYRRDEQGRLHVKLADFAFAVKRTEEGTQEATQSIMGTLSYFPPEILRAIPKRRSLTSDELLGADMWAMGATLFSVYRRRHLFPIRRCETVEDALQRTVWTLDMVLLSGPQGREMDLIRYLLRISPEARPNAEQALTRCRELRAAAMDNAMSARPPSLNPGHLLSGREWESHPPNPHDSGMVFGAADAY